VYTCERAAFRWSLPPFDVNVLCCCHITTCTIICCQAAAALTLHTWSAVAVIPTQCLRHDLFFTMYLLTLCCLGTAAVSTLPLSLHHCF
jgi:hypothetical protein